jgi:hypothetical protein
LKIWDGFPEKSTIGKLTFFKREINSSILFVLTWLPANEYMYAMGIG